MQLVKVLTKEYQIAVQTWVEQAKPLLGLSDWVIEVKRRQATVTPTPASTSPTRPGTRACVSGVQC